MIYDFDEITERRGTGCEKWDCNEDCLSGKVLPMWVADMDFKSPLPVINAVTERAKHGIYGYTHMDEDFAKSVCAFMKRRHGLDLCEEDVTFSPGVVTSIIEAVRVFTEEGDAVLIQNPVYYPFGRTVNNENRKLVSSDLVFRNGRYEIDFDDFEKKIVENDVKMFILCNPHNPVARVFEKSELERMLEIAKKHSVIIFADEIHCEFVMDGYEHVPFLSLDGAQDITVSAISVTKTFNLAGIQISAILCKNREMLEKLKARLARDHHNSPNVFALPAAVAALTQCDDYVGQLVKYIGDNIKYIQKYVADNIPKIKTYTHEGTYLMWLDCRELGLGGEELEKFFTEKAGLYLDAGSWFGDGGEGFMRLNAACPRKYVEQALKQLEKATKE